MEDELLGVVEPLEEVEAGAVDSDPLADVATDSLLEVEGAAEPLVDSGAADSLVDSEGAAD